MSEKQSLPSFVQVSRLAFLWSTTQFSYFHHLGSHAEFENQCCSVLSFIKGLLHDVHNSGARYPGDGNAHRRSQVISEHREQKSSYEIILVHHNHNDQENAATGTKR